MSEKMISSAAGPVKTGELGFTLMHEHVIDVDWSMRTAFAGWFERDVFVDRAVRLAKSAMEYGLRTIVDLTAVNMGRDIRLINEVSEKTGLQIIPCTGLYFNEDPWIPGKDIGVIADAFIKDIEEGIEGTDIRAGIIKCATDKYGFSDINRALFKATGMAGSKTGVPVYTHTIANMWSGLKQQELLESEGVDLRRVVIGHVGDTNNLGYLEEIMKRGSYVGLDRFGSDFIFPEEDRINNLLELCSRGHIDQIIISHDLPLFYDWGANTWDKEKNRPVEDVKVGFSHIPKTVIPALLNRGMTKEEIRKITVDNPRRCFEI